MRADTATTVYVFYGNEPDAALAATLATRGRKKGLTVRTINKYTSALDDLLLVAEHRVVQTPLTVVITNKQTKARLLSVATLKQILAVIK